LIPLLLLVLAADPLGPILAQMDTNAATFKSAKTGLKRVTHNAAVDIDTEASGTMVLKRPAPHDVRTLVTFTQPEPQQVFVGRGVAQLYNPKLNVVQEFKLDGKNQSLFEQFYLLAFGGSGKDLSANYDITYTGPETVGGEKTSHLQLIPRLAEVRKGVSRIDLWVTEGKAIPVQLRVTTPAKDSTTFTYTDVKLNPNVSEGDLKLRTAKGVVTQYPGR
jgi:outer membrane lipoprotein-sorting protein